MNGAYDEIISDNPFFIELKNEYANLFHHCITQAWIICVPRIGSLNTRVFTVEDFCAHILVPSDELPETHYTTLKEKQVTVTNKVITLEVTKALPLQCHILFEETFYTEDFFKYKVWCIESPLEPTAATEDNTLSKEYLISINNCIDLLWTQAAGRQVLDQIEQNVQTFIKKHPILPIAIGPLRDAVSELYTQCLQTVLQNRRIREKSKSYKQILDNIKIAVECYMQHLLFDHLFKPICTSCAYEDSHLNKKIRNMSDIQLKDLDIKRELYQAVPKAKQLLSKIDSYTTVLEKVICLKQALNAISKKDDSNNVVLLTADDMLPVFVFLVIKSGLPNWYSQLMYLKEFRFSGIGKSDGDESAFLITTLEAVIEHIQSGALTGPPDPEAYYYESNLTEDELKSEKPRKGSLTESTSTSTTNYGDETIEYIFELIKVNHTEQIRGILERNHKHLEKLQSNENSVLKRILDDSSDDGSDDDNDESNGDETEMYQQLCHPLCSCKKCCRKISRRLLKSSPTVTSRDSHGLTPLHVACIHGKAAVVELLIEMNSEINATDLNECTPLHYAASRGHQNALLLLVHSGANVNQVNIDKHTPLHLSVNNGHLNCVKALIYFSEHSRNKININCVNLSGNTPLHLASKWGYEGIAKLLIENGAEPSLQNRYNQTAYDYAHNLRILKVLKTCTPNLFEYIHLSSPNIKPLEVKPDNSDNDVNMKLQGLKVNPDDNASKTVANLKTLEKISKAISYGDVKLACFYMDVDYEDFTDTSSSTSAGVCHPLCECQSCKLKTSPGKSCYDVNFADSSGFTALLNAARCGLEELCKILILINADVNCANKKGQTALHLAALNNMTAVMRTLLNNGANINATDYAGNTPLHNASHTGNIGAAKILISFNPDVTICNGSEKTALDVAKDKVHLTIIDLIEKYVKSS